MAEKLEDLRVYQKAVAFWESVNALLDCPGYRRNRRLADQTSEANDSIPANISEGFEQPTDAAFAHYLFISKGSLGEVLSRLREARGKRYITQEELAQRLRTGDSLSRGLGAFIRYLDTCGWKDRGRYKARQRQQQRASTNRRRSDGEPAGRVKGARDAGNRDPGPEDPGPEGRGRGTHDQGPRDQGPL